MFRINNFPFVDRTPECTCDIKKVEETANAAISRIAPYMVDKDKNKLFYMDSFGMRGPVPGECDLCYETLINKIKESFKAESEDE
jgi:hypothetical protein